MIQFSDNIYNYVLEQNTISNSECHLKIYDKDFNLIKTKHIPIKKLSNFILSLAFK